MSERQDNAFRFLTIAMNKFAARPEDREASARNILIYATYLCAEQIGAAATEKLASEALDVARST